MIVSLGRANSYLYIYYTRTSRLHKLCSSSFVVLSFMPPGNDDWSTLRMLAADWLWLRAMIIQQAEMRTRARDYELNV
jgi:hypothetical protein